jgi:hypothetical protein
MRGTPRIATFARDAENYVYRGLMATIAAAKAFGDKPLVEALDDFLAKYESANSHNSPGAPRGANPSLKPTSNGGSAPTLDPGCADHGDGSNLRAWKS